MPDGPPGISLSRPCIARACAAAMAMPLGPVTAQELMLTTEPLPPYNIVSETGKEISGQVGDKIVEMMHRAAVSYAVEPSSWQRAFKLAQTKPDTCVFATARTPERETQFQWIGPLASNDWTIFTRRDNTRTFSSLEELRPYAIGGYRADVLADYLGQHGYRVTHSGAHEISLRNMLLGRIDYWASGRATATALAMKLGVEDKLRALLTFGHSSLYLACNRGVPEDVVERLRQALKTMENDGTVKRIDTQYQRQLDSLFR